MTHTGPMSRVEFVALMAMMFASIAFSIDAMLPALTDIGRELSPDQPARAGWVIAAFMLGMGTGTFFAGPLSDAFGRKRVIYVGAAIYVIGAVIAIFAQSLEVLLAARIVQGLGIAGPRIVSMAIIRDIYSGREMARIMSFVMIVFTLAPAFAPTIGAGIIAISGWHGIFVTFILFALIFSTWLALRLPEPLPPAERRALSFAHIRAAIAEMWRNPTVRLSMLMQSFAFAALLSMLSMVQPLYELSYGRGDTFHLWFGGIAVFASTASAINAALVVKLGMRRLVSFALGLQLFISAGMLAVALMRVGVGIEFPLFVFWQASVFFMAGLTMGNLNAMGMEPLGHIAGTAASVIGAVSTVIAAAIAGISSQFFTGTMTPLAITILSLMIVCLLIMRRVKRLEAHG